MDRACRAPPMAEDRCQLVMKFGTCHILVAKASAVQVSPSSRVRSLAILRHVLTNSRIVYPASFHKRSRDFSAKTYDGSAKDSAQNFAKSLGCETIM